MNNGAVALMLACAAAAAPPDRSRAARVASGAPNPSTQPSAAIAAPAMMLPIPGPMPAAVSLPEQWSLLIKRSIFARGGVPAPVPGAANPDAAGPDGHIALRGVVLEDNSQYSAFLEDTAGNHTMRVRPGDSVGMGRVKTINLDSLVFETPLRTTHVQVGQNLLGAPLPAAPAQPAGPPGPPPGGPPPGAAANLPPGVTPEMAKQMMARDARAMERLAAEQNGERRGRREGQ
jgi:hypothetical protein